MNYHLQRRQNLVHALKKEGLDAILISHPANVTYLTGFTGEAAYYIATAKHSILVSDSRFEEQIRNEIRDLEIHIRPHDKTTLEAVAEALTSLAAKSVGLEASRVTLEELAVLERLTPGQTFVPTTQIVERMRAVKDPSEVALIREAIRAAERGFKMFIATVHEADTEKMMADRLESYMRRCGARGAAFPLIIAVGERSSLPHAMPSDRLLADGSKLLVDWGADMLYKSDLTRTIRNPIGSAPTRRNKKERVGFIFEEVYTLVLEAQTAAAAAVRDGVRARDVDAAARKVLASAKVRGDSGTLNDYFTHGLGHGIGLEVHEAPRVRANSDDVLEAGMVITLEPGVYIPGWGGVRIEDDFLVTRDGCTRLTTLPPELAPIDPSP